MYTSEPVIKLALGEDWYQLDPVVRRHYDLTPGNEAVMTLQGMMYEVDHSFIAKLFLIPGRFFGALVPYKGKKIQTTVRNWTISENSKAMFWCRTFSFPGDRIYRFYSRMEYVGGNEIIEYVRYGLGIRMKLSVKDGCLVYKSSVYQWDLWGQNTSFPTWLILGAGEIVESGRTENEFEMNFKMKHPLFGKTFSYSGVFSIDN